MLVSLLVSIIKLGSLFLNVPEFLLSFLIGIVRRSLGLGRAIPEPQHQPIYASYVLQYFGNLLARLSFERQAALSRLINYDNHLSISQNLALSPDQWSPLESIGFRIISSSSSPHALEESSTSASNIRISQNSQAISPVNDSDVMPSNLVLRPPLRRSRRLQRIRVRNMYI